MGLSTDSRKPRLVVGVDFGTTFTSVAFAVSNSPNDVKLVERWPNGRVGQSNEQVPSEVLYTGPVNREHLWGYAIPKDETSNQSTLKWFKLLIQKQGQAAARRPLSGSDSPNNSTDRFSRMLRSLALFQELPQALPVDTPADGTARVLENIGLSTSAVVQDFLKDVRTVTFETMSRTWTDVFMRQTEIVWILSVPAIWTDQAKDQMIRCAHGAGYGKHGQDFHLVSEPEAAAAYALKVMQANTLSSGDTFVICDAGGGTVDLVSYKIQQLNPLLIDESVSGTGDLCGAVYLDDGFLKYIKELLGVETMGSMGSKRKHKILRSWEDQVKSRFGNCPDNAFEVVVPGVSDDEEKQIEDGTHTMTYEAVQAIFDPVVKRVVQLVKDQIAAVRAKGDTVVAVLLVGGFGSSEYLRTCVEREVNTSVPLSQIQVLQPVNARTAIARGALLQGLDGSAVKEKRARRHYGCDSSHSDYDRSDEQCVNRMYYCLYSERWLVAGHLSWFANKNAIISPTHCQTFKFSRCVDVEKSKDPSLSHSSFIFTDELYACDSQEAPDYCWREPDALYLVCQIVSDLSHIPQERFRLCIGSGREFYEVKYELKMTVVGEVLTFGMEFEGEGYGKAVMKFE